MIERRNLIDQIEQLKADILHRDEDIWSRDQLIAALRYDITLYANEEHWVLLRQCYFALQQQYGEMPQDFNRLERKYESLEDEHIDLSNRFKQLEGDHTELRVQLDQTRDERDRLEDDAEISRQGSHDAEARYWALEVQCDHIKEQKAKSEKEAGAKERFLADLAARMFKRTLSMARILVGIDINPMDDEQVALCQLAQKYLGVGANEIASSFEKVGSGENREAEDLDERDENVLSETHAHNFSLGDNAVLEGDIAEAGRPRDEGTDEDSHHFSAAALDDFPVPRGPESGFEGEINNHDQTATSPSTSMISMNIDVQRETSFETCKQERTDPAPQNSLTTSTAAALEPESSAAFANVEAASKTPFKEGSRMFQDLLKCPKAINEEANESPSLPQEAFNPPRFQDFEFGGSSSAVPFVGSETSPSALPEPTPEPIPTGIFNFSNTFLAKAPQDTFDPPRLGQNFAFGRTNSRVSFTANQRTSSNLQASITELQWANASSVPGPSSAQNISSLISQAEENTTDEETSTKNTVEKERAEKNAPELTTPHKKTPKGKKPNEEVSKNEELKKEEPKVDGPNRGQRRAASRERKAAEKKAQAQANTAAYRGRSAVAMALMGG